MVNADKLKLRHLASQGHKGAKLVIKMFQRPEVLLGTTLVGTNVSLVSLTTLGTLLMIRLFEEYGDLIAFLVYTPLVLIFGEVVPKSVYQQEADRLAPRVIFPLRFFSLLFYPIVIVLSRMARLVVRLVGVKLSRESLFVTREKVRMMLEGAEQTANVDVFDRDRLVRAVRFAEKNVGEVMIPIGEVAMLSHGQNTAEAVKMARKHGYFRLPVYEDETGRILGVLTFSIWKFMNPKLPEIPLTDLINPAWYVVESQPVDEILAELQHRDDHMTIVIDEFGSDIGMITLEDVLEVVIGKAVNLGYNFGAHLPRRKGRIEKLERERYRIDGRVLLSGVADALGAPFTNSTVHTIGGLMMRQLRHLPQPGESGVISGFRFTVETVSEKGITSLIAEPL